MGQFVKCCPGKFRTKGDDHIKSAEIISIFKKPKKQNYGEAPQTNPRYKNTSTNN